MGLGQPSGSYLLTPAPLKVSITDAEALPLISFAATSAPTSGQNLANLAEADQVVTLTVIASVASDQDIAIPLQIDSLSTASLSGDFEILTWPVIPAGKTSATFDVRIIDDGIAETSEKINITLKEPVNAAFRLSQAPGFLSQNAHHRGQRCPDRDLQVIFHPGFGIAERFHHRGTFEPVPK